MSDTLKGVLLNAEDTFTHSLKSIETDHHYIHQGQYYSYSEYKSMSSASSYAVIFKTPKTGYDIHIRGTVISTLGDSLRVQFSEIPAYSGGTSKYADIKNHNRRSTNTSRMQKFLADTSSFTNGEILLEVFLGGGTGIASTRSGTQSPTQYEWVLKQDTEYALLFTNGSSNTNIVNFTINWYEEPELDI